MEVITNAVAHKPTLEFFRATVSPQDQKNMREADKK